MSTLQGTFLAVMFLAVSGLTYGLVSLLRPAPPSANPAGDGNAAAGGPATETKPGADWLARIAALSAPVAKLALPAEGWDVSGLRIRFLNAGLRHASWPTLYFSAKALLALGLPALVLLSIGIGGQMGDSRLFDQLLNQRGSQLILLLLLALASFGYYLPNLLLQLRIKSHQRELFEAFPDAVDLIIVCIEAGLGLDAAIARTAEELRLRSPALADELHLVGLELRVGASRVKAMRNLALRTGLDEAASLVAMLVQADRFGTSIADSLRVHAEGLRTRRRLKAEEAAAKIPLKLLFPLIFFIFPSLILVLIGPAAISIYRVFLKSIVGQ